MKYLFPLVILSFWQSTHKSKKYIQLVNTVMKTTKYFKTEKSPTAGKSKIKLKNKQTKKNPIHQRQVWLFEHSRNDWISGSAWDRSYKLTHQANLQLDWILFSCVVMWCIPLYFTALRCVVQHCVALLYVHYVALHWTQQSRRRLKTIMTSKCRRNCREFLELEQFKVSWITATVLPFISIIWWEICPY